MTGPSPTLLPLFQTLVEIVARLRGPQGCPWDKEQTQKSLTQYAIEEAHELAEAIESGLQDEIRDELGDFLFQVILQAQVAQDEGHFTLAEVIDGLNKKMRRRHPHVFGETQLKDTQEVWKNWEKLKASEQKTGAAPRALFSYPRALPALQAAGKIGRKTQTWRFDWRTPEEVLLKVKEELTETEEALQAFRKTEAVDEQTRSHLEHEIGDLLFSVAQLARHTGLDAEAALRRANQRFTKRFQKVIEQAAVSKEDFAALPDAKKEELWAEVKKQGDSK